jgi:hypothetical protein
MFCAAAPSQKPVQPFALQQMVERKTFLRPFTFSVSLSLYKAIHVALQHNSALTRCNFATGCGKLVRRRLRVPALLPRSAPSHLIQVTGPQERPPAAEPSIVMAGLDPAI